MKPKKEKEATGFSENPWLPHGEWYSVDLSFLWIKGWSVLKEYTKNDYRWNFISDGIVTTDSAEELNLYADYLYDPRSRLLRINGYDIKASGKIESPIAETYRVEMINPNEIYLYYLEEVEVEPDDYSLRWHIKRILYC